MNEPAPGPVIALVAYVVAFAIGLALGVLWARS